MQKNVASQKWIVFAFDRTDNTPKTGDAANITANVRIDGAAANAVDDTNPTELEDGYYIFDITAAESNGENIVICPASSTGDIQVIGVPGAVYTRPANFPDLSVVASTGRVDVDSVGGTQQTANDNGADINAILTDTADMQPRVAAIETDTNELQTDDIPGTLSTIEGKVDTMDTNVDQIETAVITNAAGVDIAADIIAVKAETALIVADTNELQADWTNGGRLDLIADAILDDTDLIDDGTSGLAKIATDVAAVLVDTGTTLDGKIDTVDGIVDSILADTGELQTDLADGGRLDLLIDSIISLLDDARTEPGDTAPPVNPDAMTKIDYLYKFLRNKVETTSTRIHVYDDAGTNKDHSSIISDDATTFTRGEFGAGD